ncbi:MAG: DNA-3-methyladenine glycosylase family protein [Terriglobales bacterium]
MWRSLAVEPPFDFERSLRFVCAAPRAAAHLGLEPYADVWQGREYRRAVWLPGGTGPVLLRLRNQGTVDAPRLQWQAAPEPAKEPAREALRRLVAHIVSASVRLAEFQAAIGGDAVLRELGRRFAGIKIIRAPSLYECLVSTVLEQQLNFSFAHAVKRRLLAAQGQALEFEGRAYWAYPPPARLAALRPADLRPLQISERKASYLIGLARAVLAGELDAERLAMLPPEEARERLLRLRGIGRWTAAYVALRGLGHADALPAEDVGLQKSVAQLYGLRQYATARGIERRWRHLSPWRGYATYYCWFTQWA